MEEVKPIEDQQAADDAVVKAQTQLNDIMLEFSAVMKRHGVATGLCILEFSNGVVLEVDHQTTPARKLGLINFSQRLINVKVDEQAKKHFQVNK